MNYPDIAFSCPHCEVTLKLRAQAKGLTGPCPKCREIITAPEVTEELVAEAIRAEKIVKKTPPPPVVIPSGTLLPENAFRAAGEENHRRKKATSSSSWILPLVILAILAAGIIVALKSTGLKEPQAIQEEDQTISAPLEEKSDSSISKETPPETKPPAILVKPNRPAPEIPQESPPLPDPAAPEKIVSKKLQHDPQDLSRPGEIPSIAPQTNLKQAFEGIRTVPLFITQSSYCFEDLPEARRKATLHLFKTAKADETARAYLSNNSSIYQTLAKNLKPGEKKAYTLTLRWNELEDFTRPYLEVVGIAPGH